MVASGGGMLKKSSYDECGGDCKNCERFALLANAVPILTRKKVHKKFVPPDMTAIKMLVEDGGTHKDIHTMTDKELKELEMELLGKLKEQKNSKV